MASPWQTYFLDPASLLFEQSILLHDTVMVVLVGITVFVMLISGILVSNSFTHRFMTDHQKLETLWTLIPMGLLACLAVPSLHLLYLLDDPGNPSWTLKAIAHQWYWEYESPVLGESTDSYMVSTSDLDSGSYRLLEADNAAWIPYNITTSILVTSWDVLHSFAMPSLGLKVDAVPGRINQLVTLPAKMGIFYGQCSELCGANHSFMPIKLVVSQSPLDVE